MDTNGKEMRILVFDLLFRIFLLLLLAVFFIAATDYSPASRRAPLVIMVPVFIMVAVQTWANVVRIRRMRADAPPGSIKIKMEAADVSKGAQILIWLVLLLLFFYVAGHLGGTALFLLIFIRYVSRESLRTAISVAAGVTLGLYILFEKILMITLYEGWIYYMITGWLYS